MQLPQPSSNETSLGLFYGSVCSLCGFDPMSGEEWKVMGLASYGALDEEIYALLKALIKVDGLSIVGPSGYGAQKITYKLNQYARKETEPSLAAANLAYTGQLVFTEVLMEYLNNLCSRGISENLVFGGGCALNSSANGQILDRTPFKNLHVFSAPADDGNAIGAALLAYQQDHPDARPQKHLMPYLGSSMLPETKANVRQFSKIPQLSEHKEDAPERAAQLLAEGKIVGWIQGRAEYGPRALGNRSILADPRTREIKDVINSRVKFREEFRPFAPSILHECGPQYFEHYQESPYMERTLKFRREVMDRVPGVVHHDGTGRLQTVKREWNERYYRLIHRFWKLTDVPLVLNTSFNVMGKPISHSVEDVLAVFYTSGLDAVFIEDMLIEK
jgi:carbamoyltransferase